jgi:signal peptidase I
MRQKTSTPGDLASTKATASDKTAIGSKAATPSSSDGIRETVESVVVAFVLAFLFRTFEAEAFVIPTGSMAPTLMGRHKDIECKKCSFPYRVTAKPEVDDEGNRFRLQNGDPEIWMMASVCPNCGYTTSLGTSTKEGAEPSFAGDRILVAKFPYDIGEPKRWDVVVFKYPVRAHQNFIKRLVGLPGETVRILRGDIYIKGQDEADYAIARKPPDKVQAMMQIVYDNDYVLPEMIEKGWPARWQAWSLPVEQAAERGFPNSPPALASGDDGWQAFADLRSFSYDGEKPEPVWLRYTHTPPSPQDWDDLQKNGGALEPKYQQIQDFNAYNLGYSNRGGPNSGPMYWCGDLALQCEVEVGSDAGELLLELVEGGVQFVCRIDVATGEARLSHTAEPAFQPAPRQTAVKGKGIYRLAFANVDDQLLLWVDGKVIPFEAAYEPLGNIDPGGADYAPVGIASRGVKARVSHLRIMRDIYYIAASGQFSGNKLDGEDFPLTQDQFFVLGDNSAESLDARFWQETPFGPSVRYVDRDLMIGKALLIYWPHGWYEIPGTGIPFYIPIYDVPMFPNFARMGYVR